MTSNPRPKLVPAALAITFALGATAYLVVSAQKRANPSPPVVESTPDQAPSTTMPDSPPAMPKSEPPLEPFPDAPTEDMRALYSSKSLVLEGDILPAEFLSSSKSGVIHVLPESNEAALSADEAFLLGSKSGVFELVPDPNEAPQQDVYLPSSKSRPLHVLPDAKPTQKP